MRVQFCEEAIPSTTEHTGQSVVATFAFWGCAAGLVLAGMAIRRRAPAASGAALRAHADASAALRRYRRPGSCRARAGEDRATMPSVSAASNTRKTAIRRTRVKSARRLGLQRDRARERSTRSVGDMVIPDLGPASTPIRTTSRSRSPEPRADDASRRASSSQRPAAATTRALRAHREDDRRRPHHV